MPGGSLVGAAVTDGTDPQARAVALEALEVEGVLAIEHEVTSARRHAFRGVSARALDRVHPQLSQELVFAL